MICHVKNAHVPTVDTNRAVQKVLPGKQAIFVGFNDKPKQALFTEALSKVFIINEKQFLSCILLKENCCSV